MSAPLPVHGAGAPGPAGSDLVDQDAAARPRPDAAAGTEPADLEDDLAALRARLSGARTVPPRVRPSVLGPALVRPRRRRWLWSVLGVLVVLGLLAGVTLLVGTSVVQRGTRPPALAAAAGGPSLPLVVLNNSARPGLAATAAADLRAGGWTVTSTGNIGGHVSRTTVYYAPGAAPAARRLAHRFPAIRAVAPRFPGLPERGLTVVVTAGYSLRR